MKTETFTHIGHRIKWLMQQRNLTDAELARQIEMPHATLSRILSGVVQDPRISTLAAIAAVLDTTIDDLISREFVAPVQPGYKLVSPEDFTEEQKIFLDSFQDSVNIISSQTELVFGFKDIHSKHVISTDAFAHLVALPHGQDIAGRFDRDLPCEGVAQFAEDFVNEDSELLSRKDPNRKKSILNIHEFATGPDAFIADKYPLKHQLSQSILGVIYTAHRVEISNFFTLFPNYFLKFGMGSSIEIVNGPLGVGGALLTEYEHEVCFLMTLDLSFNQIACFMNMHRPLSALRDTGTIYECKERIYQKLNCLSSSLREMLIDAGVHKKIPSSFFNRLIGYRPLS
jgi:transcriptional regulator with XRE-family HTH domain